MTKDALFAVGLLLLTCFLAIMTANWISKKIDGILPQNTEG